MRTMTMMTGRMALLMAVRCPKALLANGHCSWCRRPARRSSAAFRRSPSMRWARFFSNSRMNTATPTSTTIVRTALNVSTTPQPLSRRELLGTRWERGDVPARARTRRLLEPGAHRGDALGVEAEPVHPSDVTRVLDLQTTVHDHRHAPLLGRPRTLLVDHAELAPQG